ncbi:hypothetical protein M422DRAFT_775882 [Sphaerobolus stellatus SS14]|nr:hypothetical protein M422DRAFT_775882 [Sphaerobolus stellatus SS14]
MSPPAPSTPTDSSTAATALITILVAIFQLMSQAPPIVDPPIQAPTAPSAPTTIKMKVRKGKARVENNDINSWTKPTDLLPFRPFEKIMRGNQWAVSEQGKHWISKRIPSYREMKPPAGMPIDETTNHFDEEEVLGADPTPAMRELHKERVVKFIDYAVVRQNSAAKESPSDILSLLINRARKPIAYNHWAENIPGVDDKARALASMDPKWVDPREHLHLLMEARKTLFSKLPEEEQAEWDKSAEESKNKPITPEDCILLIPKIYGMVGDAIRKLVNFNCVILCGGKGVEHADGIAAGQGTWFYSEEWHHPSVIASLGFTSTDNWKVITGTFLKVLAEETKVNTEDIKQLPTWQRPSEFIPKVVERLSDILEFDQQSELVSTLEAARQGTEKYLDALYSLVPDRNGGKQSKPIPWTHVYRAGSQSGRYYEAARLPTPEFFLLRLKDMPTESLLTFIRHIIKGEKGELPPSRIFQWANQGDGMFHIAPKPRKQTRTSGHKKKAQGGGHRSKKVAETSRDEEIIELDGISSSDESDAKETSEQVRERITTCGNKRKSRVIKASAKRSKSHVSGTSTGNRDENSTAKRDDRSQKGNSSMQRQSRSGASPTLPNPLPKSKGRRASISDHDSDSTSDEQDEYQVVFPGDADPLFAGDAQAWMNDFDMREAAIDWEDDEAVEFGPTTVESVRFIESGERLEAMSFHRILDMAQPMKALDDDVHELIFDTASPLPDIIDIPHVDWTPVLDVLSGRVKHAIRAIKEMRPSAGSRWLRLGNPNGALLLLRLVELVRRVAIHLCLEQTQQRVREVRTALNTLLAKEAWRRWAKASFHINLPIRMAKQPGDLFHLWDIWMGTQMHSSIDARLWSELRWRCFLKDDGILSCLASEAAFFVREPEDRLTALTLRSDDWKQPLSVAEVKDWCNMMDKATFLRGCVIERFQYIFALQMMSWWGDATVKGWSDPAVAALEDWLADGIRAADRSALPRYKRTLRSKRFFPKAKVLQQDDATEQHTAVRESTPEFRDLDVPPQKLEIPPSPQKDQRTTTTKGPAVEILSSNTSHTLMPNGISSDGDVEAVIIAPVRKRKASDDRVGEGVHGVKRLKTGEVVLPTKPPVETGVDREGEGNESGVVASVAGQSEGKGLPALNKRKNPPESQPLGETRAKRGRGTRGHKNGVGKKVVGGRERDNLPSAGRMTRARKAKADTANSQPSVDKANGRDGEGNVVATAVGGLATLR